MDHLDSVNGYLQTQLARKPELAGFLDDAAVVWYASSAFMEWYDPDLVRDLLIVLPDERFENFKTSLGSNYVVDDHDAVPPIFVRFKSYEWLRRDFARRLPVALWIYQHSRVLRDPQDRFTDILRAQSEAFKEQLPSILRRKYLEFRTDRHNLRHTVPAGMDLATRLIKASVVKLALELTLLAEGRPYPYKKWLFWAVEKEAIQGREIVNLITRFWDEADKDQIIVLSDQLVAKVSSICAQSGFIPGDVTTKWWLHLD
jgi:hypothetical protein